MHSAKHLSCADRIRTLISFWFQGALRAFWWHEVAESPGEFTHSAGRQVTSSRLVTKLQRSSFNWLKFILLWLSYLIYKSELNSTFWCFVSKFLRGTIYLFCFLNSLCISWIFQGLTCLPCKFGRKVVWFATGWHNHKWTLGCWLWWWVSWRIDRSENRRDYDCWLRPFLCAAICLLQ